MTAAPNAATGNLPERGAFLVKDASVMTMDPALGDLAHADVHVADGAIVAVGGGLDAPGAVAIDGRGMIVLPGFVETHWHMWNSLLRSMAGDSGDFGYFPTVAALGKSFLPGDMYQGTRLAAAEAIFSGITTVHDWSHNCRGRDYAEADLRALGETGVRGRFSLGAAKGHSPAETCELAALEALQRDWSAYADDGRLTLGLGWRGRGGAKAPIPREIYLHEFDTARRLGLPISVHASSSRAGIGQIAAIAAEVALGPDVQVIHANFATDDEIRILADSGASVSLSPYTELRIGYGMLQTGKFLDAGVPTGLSVDTTVLSGNADMFAIMKIIQNAENGASENEFKLHPRRIIELATIEGARCMGLDDRIGSLTPGKRADLIMVTTEAINMGPFTDPAHLIVEAAQPANVDTVMIDGRLLKHGGRLTSLDPRRIVAEASAALAAVRERAGR
jgi:5-methylthioadenosine/S-adenosylhomocysteine deaminase